jgi:CheY-like chemotaxis protein
MLEVESVGPTLRKSSILIVEDNIRVRNMIRTVLSEFGVARVRGAGDGIEGLSALKASPPDIIITDWEMAPMDGLTFVRRVRNAEMGVLAMVPIVMLTAYTSPTLVKSALQVGANLVVPKPIVPAQLYKRLAWLVEHPGTYQKQGARIVVKRGGGLHESKDADRTAPAAQDEWVID